MSRCRSLSNGGTGLIGRSRERAVPETALLVRMLAVDAAWPDRLPAVPPGHLVSVTVSTPSMAARWPEIEARGYRFAGEVAAPLLVRATEVTDVVDIVVDQSLIDEDPLWWRSLARHAWHTFPLAFGPVLHVFSDVLDVHGSVWVPLHAR